MPRKNFVNTYISECYHPQLNKKPDFNDILKERQVIGWFVVTGVKEKHAIVMYGNSDGKFQIKNSYAAYDHIKDGKTFEIDQNDTKRVNVNKCGLILDFEKARPTKNKRTYGMKHEEVMLLINKILNKVNLFSVFYVIF